MIEITNFIEDFIVINKIEKYIKSFIKAGFIALLVWLITTKILQFGIQKGLNIWFVNGSCIILGFIIKWILSLKFKVYDLKGD